MLISDLISPGRVSCCPEATSKKKALEQLSALLSESMRDRTSGEVFDSLLGRERLGSTGLGKGVAIPHGRVPGLDEPVAAFIKLDHGVDFDAADSQPVDLLFALLVPDTASEEHLQLLSQLAQMFSDGAFCNRLRASTSDNDLFELLNHWEPRGVPA